ncbi:hypothetical protein ACGFW5_18290 [Streptomyces sp. NPDC048416]|uniref:hypothetical protein n=1 Tax=Streptomyces sp. NPDC048416 TaxID=3365546 RepID=UPI003710308B
MSVLGRFPAGGPRGSWPAEELAAQFRKWGRTVTVVMDLESDAFLVVEQRHDETTRPPLHWDEAA